MSKVKQIKNRFFFFLNFFKFTFFFFTQKKVKLADLSSELRKRFKSSSSEDAVIVQYESNNVCNMTIIDSPGLLEEDDSGTTKDEREGVVLSLAKPTHRLILCVESCKEWNKMDTANFIKKVDPEFTRTT